MPSALKLPPPPPSPLRQTNLGPATLTPKVNHSWAQLTTNPELFKGQSATSISRFFSDLFYLSVGDGVVRECIRGLPTEALLGEFKNNMTQLFTNAVKLLKETGRADARRAHVVETLIPFLADVLGRDITSYQIMTLLAGSLERSDSIFTDLVSAIDLTLRDTLSSTELRHRTLQLTLLIVSSTSQGSLNSYFLQRDLFSTLTLFMSTQPTSAFLFESYLLLGLLSHYRKYEARNPYLARLEDFVDLNLMAKMIQVVTQVCEETRGSYTTLVDDVPPGFVASLTSLFLGGLELVRGGFSLALPSAPVDSTGKGKGKEVLKEGEDEEGTEPSEKDTSVALSPPPSAPSSPIKRRGSYQPQPLSASSAKTENAFRSMPPEMVVILLPFYDLLNSNKAFCTLVFADTEDGPAPLPPALISLSSYILCHASLSERSRAYGRLCIILMTILVEEGEGKLTRGGAGVIRVCRQRLPMLPYSNVSGKPPIAAMLDTCLIYLRHNLSKKLDVECYILCLKLVQRIMQQLKTERVRLEYDWVTIWRSIISLSGFLISKHAELEDDSSLGDLISQIFIVLSYACYWGESIFPNTLSSCQLYYELLRASSVLQSLPSLLGAPPTSARESTVGNQSRDTPVMSTFSLEDRKIPLTPTRTKSSKCQQNILSLLSYFNHEISITVTPPLPPPSLSALSLQPAVVEPSISQKKAREEITPEEILAIIERTIDGLELSESGDMEDLRRYAEDGKSVEGFFALLVDVVGADAAGLVSQ